MKSESRSVVSYSVTPWTIQSMEFSRPEYWSGLSFPSPGDLPNLGMKPRSPALQADSLRTEPQGMPYSTGGGSLSLLQWIFPIQELSQGLLHCRRIFFYQLKYQGSPLFSFFSSFQVPIFWEKGGRSSLQSGLLCLRSTKAQLTDYTPQLCLSWPPRLHWLYHELGLPLYCKVMTDFLM